METKNLKVIYKILNKVNGKFYIGSTVNYIDRFNEHKRTLKQNKHHNKKLQNSYNKHGEENFEYIIIEYLNDNDNQLLLEQHYIDKLKPQYNIALSSTAPMLGRKHTEETKKKIIEFLKTIPKGEKHFNYGRKWTEEQKLAFIKQRTGTTRSEETRRKQSEISKRLNRYKDLIPAIEKFKKSIADNKGNIFKSLTEAAKYHNISVQTVCDILKGRHTKTRSGVKFKYV